jgi:hypothetical protein
MLSKIPKLGVDTGEIAFVVVQTVFEALIAGTLFLHFLS